MQDNIPSNVKCRGCTFAVKSLCLTNYCFFPTHSTPLSPKNQKNTSFQMPLLFFAIFIEAMQTDWKTKFMESLPLATSTCQKFIDWDPGRKFPAWSFYLLVVPLFLTNSFQEFSSAYDFLKFYHNKSVGPLDLYCSIAQLGYQVIFETKVSRGFYQAGSKSPFSFRSGGLSLIKAMLSGGQLLSGLIKEEDNTSHTSSEWDGYWGGAGQLLASSDQVWSTVKQKYKNMGFKNQRV